MKTVEISVTDAARKFSDCLNRVHYQDVSFVLVRNGEPVARIVPEHGRRTLGGEIADALAGHEGLSREEAAAWRQELEEARESLLPVEDKWA
ncbi:MAG: type II toxin-antitoxin system prevent-host-death family antitoxin [Acidobacteriaceae bacterium]